MTIAQAFNEIAVAQGGTASKSGSITGAIDALNDALAGSDQASAQTIEDAVRLLGQNIGGGGGGEEYEVKCYKMGATPSDPFIPVDSCAYVGVWDADNRSYVPSGNPITNAHGGEIIVVSEPGHDYAEDILAVASSADFASAHIFATPSGGGSFYSCPMPAANACFIYAPIE